MTQDVELVRFVIRGGFSSASSRVVNGVVQPDARDRLPDGCTITDIVIAPLDEEPSP